MVKSWHHNDILECMFMEVFYLWLSKDIEQTVDAMFVGEMLRSSYNEIKSMLDSMANNSEEWDDDGFDSH